MSLFQALSKFDEAAYEERRYLLFLLKF